MKVSQFWKLPFIHQDVKKTILAIAPYCTNEMWSQGNNRGYILAKYKESGGKEYSEIAAMLTREDPTVIKDIRKSRCDLRKTGYLLWLSKKSSRREKREC